MTFQLNLSQVEILRCLTLADRHSLSLSFDSQTDCVCCQVRSSKGQVRWEGDLHECGNGAVVLLTHPVEFNTGGHSVQGVEASETNKYKCGQGEGEDEGKVGDEHHVEEAPEAAPEKHGVCEVDDGEGAGDEDSGERT